MTTTLTRDCPHCGTANAGFTQVYAIKHPHRQQLWNSFLVCGGCGGALIAELMATGAHNPGNHPGNLESQALNASEFRVLQTLPRAQEADIPSHLPDRVARAFGEGCAIVHQSPNGACAQFRRALELGLKDLAPEVEAWRLEKRIDKLTERHLLTPAIRDWAHRLRMDGNDAVHGDDDATVEFAQEMEALTRFVLTYLYTLPKQVELASTGAPQ